MTLSYCLSSRLVISVARDSSFNCMFLNAPGASSRADRCRVAAGEELRCDIVFVAKQVRVYVDGPRLSTSFVTLKQ